MKAVGKVLLTGAAVIVLWKVIAGIFVGLLAMALNAMNYPARSLLGHQAEVVTDCTYGNARILDIGAGRIKEFLEKRNISDSIKLN